MIPAQRTGLEITQPGVYDGIPADVYHQDPVPGGSLSSTGLRRLTKPSTPAAYREWRKNPPLPTKTFTFGHAAHKVILGEGADFAIFEPHDARTKEGKAIRAEQNAATADGKIAITTDDYAVVEAMATAIRSHQLATALLEAEGSKSEQAMFWQDPETGTWCRSLIDRLRKPIGGRLILVDYKTADSADSTKFSKSAASYGYHQQADHYSTGARTLGLADDVPFVFVVQEKDPPYLVNVIQLDKDAMQIGAHLNRLAINLYAECTARDEWPGYGDDVSIVPLPGYYQAQFEEIL